MTKDYAIKVEGLSKAYGKKVVFSGLDFGIEKGSSVGIEGENGSGKSTLLNILAGFTRADSGKIGVSGRMGFCPQVPLLFMQLSIMENIRLFSRAYYRNEIPDQTILSGWIGLLFDQFRIKESRGKLCSQLSGGTLQKLNLIISVLHQPDILLLDEPYTGFDWETYLAFWEFYEKLKEEGKTVIVISHLIYARDRLDHTWKLKDGNLYETA